MKRAGRRSVLLTFVALAVPVTGPLPASAQDGKPAGWGAVLTPDGVSPMAVFAINPAPNSSDGSQIAALILGSEKGCGYPSEVFEVPVQLNDTSFGLIRVLRVSQSRQPDGSCTEGLAMRFSPEELQDLAASKSIVLHMPTGAITLTEEARHRIAAVAPAPGTVPSRPAQAYADMLNALLAMLPRGEAKQARELAEALAPAYRARPPEESVVFFTMLGRLRRLAGDLEDAGSSNEVVVLIAGASGQSNPVVATAYDNLATIRRLQKRWEAATAASDGALSMYEKTVGTKDPSYATALNNRAVLLADQGDFEQALAYSERALDILRNTVDADFLKPYLNDNRTFREKSRRR